MRVFIDFWKLETENSLLHVFSFLHKLSFENNFCFLPVLSCQTSFLVSKIENCFWKQKTRGKNSYQIYPYVPEFVHVCHFCGVRDHIRPNCNKLKFKHSVFQSRICDDISPAISPYKLFHILLKNLSLLACERNLQDFGLFQKTGVIPQIHSTSHGFSPTKLKTCAIWVRKDSPRWVLLTCSWFNSFN